MTYGIDIGGTKIELALFDEAFRPVFVRRASTPAHDYAAFLDAVATLVEQADRDAERQAAVGIGIPGLIDGQGRLFTSNLPGVNGRTVAADLGSRLDRTVVLDNDCRCFALSEATGGAGEGHDAVLVAILGTGAACGFVKGGTLLSGRHLMAGEYGHLPLPAVLQQKYGLPLMACGCGNIACIECYIAGPGLMNLARHFGSSAPGTVALAEAWRAGEAAACATRDCFLDLLGSVFADLVKLYDPEVIVMGGGLSLIPEVVDQLPGAMANHLFPSLTPPSVVRARFGDSSGGRGAAILARSASPSR